ncbi:hypothetical protein DEIPH_ctg052orf0042 [Deinococcus phoenicis]|uniref:Uncharacterized protein n=1 Tax=Deinococcus phoenicis TaxID=1476583 RepID=A0A016QMT9_9DEIO|nr:hypothetical protein [Deinococcus phoenicis]EYB67044.1 hypothetical protein DEIPH_ctg052orf0042 [Deinococcus phoenicis]
MKALTLRHPWGFAIGWAGKDIENRDWDDRVADLMGLPQIIGEPVAIHSGSCPKRGRNQGWREFIAGLKAMRANLGGELPGSAAQFLASRSPEGPFAPEAFLVSGIVAVAVISGTTRASRSSWAVPGQLHLMLSQVVALPEPVECRGAQGFWEVPEVVEREVRRQVEQVQVTRPPIAAERTGADWLGL